MTEEEDTSEFWTDWVDAWTCTWTAGDDRPTPVGGPAAEPTQATHDRP